MSERVIEYKFEGFIEKGYVIMEFVVYMIV